MNKKYDYLIVGAGLYGSTFARLATDDGKKCLVIDKRSQIAGNIYTEKVNDINVHKYGAHIFHTSNTKVWEFAQKFCEFNDFINSPKANYKGEIYSLPFNMNTFHEMWGIDTAEEAKEIIEKQKAEAMVGEPNNLEEQAMSLVGKDIYEKLVKGYTEKQWGRDCKDLPSFIIKRLPVRFIYDNNYFNDTYQGIPKNGYTDMVERMLEGIEVRLNVDFLENKEELSGLADKIIYTGMIDEFYGYVFGELEYRSLRFETEIMPETDDYQGNAVINYTDRETPFTRIIEHKHFEFNKCKGTIISREYPSTWNKGDEPYYPMNDERNNELYKKYCEHSKKDCNVFFGGRLGQYKYFDMDDTIESAMKDYEEKFC